MPDERDEILAAREGDLDACSRLFARHWRMVRAWLFGFTRDRDEVEDLTQQTFIRAHERLRQLRDPDRFVPWLRKVARTVAFSRRHRGEIVRRGLQLVSESAADAAERRETHGLVARALDRLPRRDRSLLALVYTEELPLARVADLLGLPPTTLRRRLAAALNRFRRAYEREGGGSYELHRRA